MIQEKKISYETIRKNKTLTRFMKKKDKRKKEDKDERKEMDKKTS